MAWNMSTAKRRALVKLQLRDKNGRWIEMGGGVKWYSSKLKKVVAGTVVGTKGGNALVRLNKENPTHEPALVSVPAHNIEVVDAKAKITIPGKNAPADQTPEFEEPEAVGKVEGRERSAAFVKPSDNPEDYKISDTADGRTYISRADGAELYFPARSLDIGDELISPEGADETKPFSIGKAWARKGAESINTKGPKTGKVIDIAGDRYAVVRLADGVTIDDPKRPGEQTDTVTVGLTNSVIKATPGLKTALGNKLKQEDFAEQTDAGEEEVGPEIEAQSDHVGREVPEEDLELEEDTDPEAEAAPEEDDAPIAEEEDPAVKEAAEADLARRVAEKEEARKALGDQYDENGLTPEENTMISAFERMANRAADQFDDIRSADFFAKAEDLRAVGRRRLGESKEEAEKPAPEAEKAPESAPEPEKAPEVTPEPEAAPEAAPETPEEEPEFFVPGDGMPTLFAATVRGNTRSELEEFDESARTSELDQGYRMNGNKFEVYDFDKAIRAIDNGIDIWKDKHESGVETPARAKAVLKGLADLDAKVKEAKAEIEVHSSRFLNGYDIMSDREAGTVKPDVDEQDYTVTGVGANMLDGLPIGSTITTLEDDKWDAGQPVVKAAPNVWGRARALGDHGWDIFSDNEMLEYDLLSGIRLPDHEKNDFTPKELENIVKFAEKKRADDKKSWDDHEKRKEEQAAKSDANVTPPVKPTFGENPEASPEVAAEPEFVNPGEGKPTLYSSNVRGNARNELEFYDESARESEYDQGYRMNAGKIEVYDFDRALSSLEDNLGAWYDYRENTPTREEPNRGGYTGGHSKAKINSVISGIEKIREDVRAAKDSETPSENSDAPATPDAPALEQGTRVKIKGKSSANRYFVLGTEGDKAYIIDTVNGGQYDKWTPVTEQLAETGISTVKKRPITDLEVVPHNGKARLKDSWASHFNEYLDAKAGKTPEKEAPKAPEVAPASKEQAPLSEGEQFELPLPGIKKQGKSTDKSAEHRGRMASLEAGDRVSHTNAHGETSTYQKHEDGTWDLLDPEDEWEDQSPLEEALTADEVAQRHKRGDLEISTGSQREEAEEEQQRKADENSKKYKPLPTKPIDKNEKPVKTRAEEEQQEADSADKPWSAEEIASSMRDWFDFAQAVKNGDTRAIETMANNKRTGDEETDIIVNDKGQPFDLTLTYNDDGDPVVRLSNFDDSKDIYGDFEIDSSVMPKQLSTLIHESINADDVAAAVTERNGAADRALDERENADLAETGYVKPVLSRYMGHSKSTLAKAIAEDPESGLEIDGNDVNVRDLDKAQDFVRDLVNSVQAKISGPNATKGSKVSDNRIMQDLAAVLKDINQKQFDRDGKFRPHKSVRDLETPEEATPEATPEVAESANTPELDEIGKHLSENYVDGTEDERRAAGLYLGGAQYNSALRDGNVNEFLQERIDQLTGFIEKQPEFGRETTLYRGLSSAFLPDAENRIGETVTEPAFMSTSLRKDQAELFAGTGGGILMEIKARPEDRGLSINGARLADQTGIPEEYQQKLNVLDHEGELLLAPNTSLKITSVENVDGRKVVRAEIVDAPEVESAPEAPALDERGLTESEAEQWEQHMIDADVEARAGDDDGVDEYRAKADEVLKKGEDRLSGTEDSAPEEAEEVVPYIDRPIEISDEDNGKLEELRAQMDEAVKNDDTEAFDVASDAYQDLMEDINKKNKGTFVEEEVEEPEENPLDALGIERRTPEAIEGEDYPPTQQQQDVIDAVLAGLDTKVQAMAGTGKTSTLVALSRRLKEEGKQAVYIAFNKTVQLEAEKRMEGLLVEAKTGHGTAYNWASVKMPHLITRMGNKDPMKPVKFDKKGEPTDYATRFSVTRTREIADILGINNDDVQDADGANIKRGTVVLAVKKTVQSFQNSDKDTVLAEHIPESFEIGEDSKEQVVKFAQAYWDDLSSESGVFRVEHDTYRKHWGLSRPDLTDGTGGNTGGATILFIDEAQDTPPVLAKVVADQKMQKVIVGDANQAIYAFAENIDYLSEAGADVALPLNKSWRFGPEVADAGNRFLQILGSDDRVVGGGAPSSIVYGMEDADAVLVRTNAGMIQAILDEAKRGRKVSAPNGTKQNLESMVKTVQSLMNGEAPEEPHDDLLGFKNWDEVLSALDGGDTSVRMIANMFDVTNPKVLGSLKPGEHEEMVQKKMEDAKKAVSSLVMYVPGYEDIEVVKEGDRHFIQAGPSLKDPKKRTWAGRNFSVALGETKMPWVKWDKNLSWSEKKDKAHTQGGLETEGWTFDSRSKRYYTDDEDTAKAFERFSGEVDVTISTAHKSKGLEWDRVRIGDDFIIPYEDKSGAMIWPEPDEFKLAYVAVTRAAKELDPGILSYVYEHTAENGGIPKKKKVDDSEPAPEQVEEEAAPTNIPDEVAEEEVDVPEPEAPEEVAPEEAPVVESVPEVVPEPEAEPEVVAPAPEPEPAPEVAPEPVVAPTPEPVAKAPAPKPAPTTAPVPKRYEGLTPPERRRAAELERWIRDVYEGKGQGNVKKMENELFDLLERGEKRLNRDLPVSDPVVETPEAPEAPAVSVPETPTAPEVPEVAPAPDPASKPVPANRAPRGSFVGKPMLDANGNEIAVGDVIGHRRLGPVTVTGFIPSTGRAVFIDPKSGKEASVKADNVVVVKSDVAEPLPETPASGEPGIRFTDPTTGKKAFYNGAGTAIVTGERVVDSRSGRAGTVIGVYRGADGLASVPVLWDDTGVDTRVRGVLLEHENKGGGSGPAPEPTPEAPVTPDVTPDPEPTPEPEAPAAPEPEATPPALDPQVEAIRAEIAEAKRKDELVNSLTDEAEALPLGSVVTAGDTTFTKVQGEDQPYWKGETPRPNGGMVVEEIGDFDLASAMVRTHGQDALNAVAPEPEPEGFHSGLEAGTFMPSQPDSTSGLRKVGDDRWEMVSDGTPTGKQVSDEFAKMLFDLNSPVLEKPAPVKSSTLRDSIESYDGTTDFTAYDQATYSANPLSASGIRRYQDRAEIHLNEEWQEKTRAYTQDADGNPITHGVKVWNKKTGEYVGITSWVETRGADPKVKVPNETTPYTSAGKINYRTLSPVRLTSTPPKNWNTSEDLEFSGASNVAQINERLSGSYPSVHFKIGDTLDLEAAKEYAKLVSKLFNKYPMLQNSMNVVESRGANDNSLAWVDTPTMDTAVFGDQTMALNAWHRAETGDFVNKPTDKEAIDKAVRHASSDGFFNEVPEGREMEYTVTHEFGHVLDNLTGWMGRGRIYQLLEEFIKGEEPDGSYDLSKTLMERAELSGYSLGIWGSAVDSREFVAEAFADVELNGNDAKPLNKLIHLELMNELKGLM